MKKTGAIKLILIILIMSAVLVSCTEEEYRASRLYKSLTSYEQKGDMVTLKNKKYNKITLLEEAVLDISKGQIYNADFDEALNIKGASTISIINSEIISKTIGIRATEKDTVVNVLSTDIASYGDFVLRIADSAIFTGSSLQIANLSETGAGIQVLSKAAIVLNNSNVTAKGTGIESDSLVSVSASEMTVESLKFYEGATVTFDDSSFYTKHGLLIMDNPNENLIHVSLNLKKVKFTADAGALVSMIDTKASLKMEETSINQNEYNVVSLKNSEGTLTLFKSNIEGSIFADDNSSFNILLKEGSVFKGNINKDSKSRTVTVQIEENSIWELTSDSYVRGIIVKDKNLNGIKSNGFTIFYDTKCVTNTWLDKATITLPDGGKLVPLK
ncbi:MAG: hypothetical protein WC332_03140 [Clostridia bacterium]|jgi:hypothetical protein